MKRLLIVLFILTQIIIAQEPIFYNLKLRSSFDAKENWLCDQTFCYNSASLDTSNKLTIDLLEDNETFSIPKHGKLWSYFKKHHKGLDIDLEIGDTIKAMFDGIVRYAKYNDGGFGNLIIIRHYNGLETYYAHLSKFKVKVNDTIKAGQFIGCGGNTGRSKSPHLHLEVRYKDHPLDPFSFIDWNSKTLKTEYLVLNNAVFEPWNYQLDYAHMTAYNNSSANNSAVISNTINDTKEEKTDNNSSEVKVISDNPTYHIVLKGETLYAISRKYGVSVKDIISLNNISNPDKISAGDKLRIK